MPTASGRPTADEKRAKARAARVAALTAAAAPFAAWAAGEAADLKAAADTATGSWGGVERTYGSEAEAWAVRLALVDLGATYPTYLLAATTTFRLASGEAPKYGVDLRRRT